MTPRQLPVALAVAVGFAAAPSAQQPPARPTFKGNTQVVSVDVIVRDGSGAVVKGLTAADFEVTEDGKPQAIRSFTFEEISEHPKGVETADLLALAQARLADDAKRQQPGVRPAAAAPPAAAA